MKEREEFILELDERFRKMAKRPLGRVMVASIRDLTGVRDIEISHAEFAKCKSRFDRCKLIRSRI